MTLSADSHPDREFAAMLRRGEETMSVVGFEADSVLVGRPISALDATIIAVRTHGGAGETIPERERSLEVGDALFAIGRPDALRKLEATNGVQVVDSEDDLRGVDASADPLGLDAASAKARQQEDD